MNETNPLREKLENTVITRTFNVSGMPEAVYQKVDSFCKLHFGDSRWTMIMQFVKDAEQDYKYMMLYDMINDLKAEIKTMAQGEEVKQPENKLKTFGKGGKE